MNTYNVGQRFGLYQFGEFQGTYILAQVDDFKVSLISLKSGNRWVNPVTVIFPMDITQKEFDKISDPGENDSFFIQDEN